MARKTKAEKQAAQQAEREAIEAREAAEYSTRLMEALKEATKEHYDLTVHDGQFKLVNYSNNQTYSHVLNCTHTPESWRNLYALEVRLISLAVERAEANRLYKLKQEALSKLSDEERRVLGL